MDKKWNTNTSLVSSWQSRKKQSSFRSCHYNIFAFSLIRFAFITVVGDGMAHGSKKDCLSSLVRYFSIRISRCLSCVSMIFFLLATLMLFLWQTKYSTSFLFFKQGSKIIQEPMRIQRKKGGEHITREREVEQACTSSPFSEQMR